MLLLQASAGVSIAVLVISVLGAVVAASGITYYLVKLNGNAQLDCNANYNDNSQITLNPSVAKAMIKEYNTANNNNPSETRSVWFSLKSIQKFACMIENNAKNNCNGLTSDALGIRIYFAKYTIDTSDNAIWNTNGNNVKLNGDDNTYYGKMNDCPGHNTLILVPTYATTSAGKAINKDFDPTNADGSGNPVDMASICSASAPQTNALMMNHGGMIPPPFPVNNRDGSTVSDFYYSTCGCYFLDM